ncbi:hypothetical protein FHS55_001578 [Angulomicrobium tetraedrale]|uniref:DUF3102 domain-containing protein n=1 Tax=Ancylobacter tetraedralis TaxID=217068 RepID=A0A839Z798_9HYPH|nr:DUF3102 domain-containing protein [Ancylobacter tetraedralis]MBB3770983.1 hypothetical protein [Ancylobacter tetraedralis]
MQQAELISPARPVAETVPVQPFDYAALTPADATKLREVVTAIRCYQKKVGQQIIAIGELLLAAKQGLGHGHFGDWLAAEFGWGERTAQNYMRAAEVFASKSASVSYLPPTTIYQLASPSTPEPVRAAVVERLEQGERLSHDEIKSIVRHGKAAERRAREDAKRTPEQRRRRQQVEARRQRQLERHRQEREAELNQEAAARKDAARLIVQHVGDDTERLVELLKICRGIYAADLAAVRAPGLVDRRIDGLRA